MLLMLRIAGSGAVQPTGVGLHGANSPDTKMVALARRSGIANEEAYDRRESASRERNAVLRDLAQQRHTSLSSNSNSRSSRSSHSSRSSRGSRRSRRSRRSRCPHR